MGTKIFRKARFVRLAAALDKRATNFQSAMFAVSNNASNLNSDQHRRCHPFRFLRSNENTMEAAREPNAGRITWLCDRNNRLGWTPSTCP